MAKLVWDKTGERYYETGVSHGVLYLKRGDEISSGSPIDAYYKAVAWNGLTAVTESPSGAEANDLYADDIKYASLRSAETFGATIEAYSYPQEFIRCDGQIEVTKGVYLGQQARETFGFVYKSVIGNDTASESDDGYKLHLIYGATASPSEKAYSTINDSPEAITFSWEVTSIPATFDLSNRNALKEKLGDRVLKPVSAITIDSRRVDKVELALLENMLFGTDETIPWLPQPDVVYAVISKDGLPGPNPPNGPGV